MEDESSESDEDAAGAVFSNTAGSLSQAFTRRRLQKPPDVIAKLGNNPVSFPAGISILELSNMATALKG